jgi:LCP family protein required for cell wall assembly
MSLLRSRLRLALAAVLVLLALGAAATIVVVGRVEGRSAGGPSVAPSLATTPAAPAYELSVRLGQVQGRGPRGTAGRRDLREPAAAVRRTLADLYSMAFVDRARWEDGRFPGLESFFAPAARPEARRDLDELTLGRTARTLLAVRPRPARLDVRFATDGSGHPVVAFAELSFSGSGLAADGVRIPVSQTGRYVMRKLNGEWRVVSWDVRAGIPGPGRVRAKVREARFAPGPASRVPLFVLVIGSDARPGQIVTATRADSLHIVAVNPRLRRGAIVGIPRDSYVPIPGHGTSKINAALFYGGPDLVVRTVEQLTGVHIDAYLLTGFDGFHRLIDAIGGIDVTVPYPMSDPNSGAHFRPGATHLNGREALAFSRDRHDAPGGDLGRSLNQGRVLLATLRALRETIVRDPARLLPWIVSASRFVRTDLSISQMAELLLAASTFEPGRIRDAVVYGSGATVNGQSIVRLGSAAQAVFHDLARNGVLGR